MLRSRYQQLKIENLEEKVSKMEVEMDGLNLKLKNEEELKLTLKKELKKELKEILKSELKQELKMDKLKTLESI